MDSLTPTALVGAGGIGKTSIALTILHDDRIKQRFGGNRRFIRCDQFPATHTHFLHRLSKVIGAGAENPEDLAPLRPFLSSREMLIVLDNAESILDPQGANAWEIYAVVEELTRFDNICLCLTSRISTIPPDCKILDIPTLSMEAARSTFYGIYKNGERSYLADNILERLDFHPLSITLLAIVAHHNRWNADRLIREWERQRTAVLQTDHNQSLAATIEFSLVSPMFQELGPDARGLLEVVAFFPQGVDENNLDQLFPTIPNRENIFDKFCVLSLAYRSNGFVTMLAPLRDHLRPKAPKLSPLLRATKERYFGRLSVGTERDEPGFEETRWITSEDVNIEYLLDVFTSIDPNSNDVWDACATFVRQLRQHKPRLVVLWPKIEGLPDDHPSKPWCLLHLSQLLGSIGMYGEKKRLLVHTLKLWRGRRNNLQVARTLRHLASANRRLGLHKEGILQAKEASEVYERLNDRMGHVDSLQYMALLLAEDYQADTAEEVASRAINLASDGSRQSQVCEHHRILGQILRSRGETEAAINHFKTALEIASSLDSRGAQALALHSLVHLLLKEDRFDDAQVYLEHLKLHMANDPFNLDLVMLFQACAWYQQGRLEEAKLEFSRIIGVYEDIGVSADLLGSCRELLRVIEDETNYRIAPDEPGDGELLGTILLLASIDPLCARCGWLRLPRLRGYLEPIRNLTHAHTVFLTGLVGFCLQFC